MKLDLRPSKEQGALRCAYCHDEEGRLEACPGCGTLLHAECAAEGCPTLRCVRRIPRSAFGNLAAFQAQQQQAQIAAQIQAQQQQDALWAAQQAQVQQAQQAARDTNLAGAGGGLPQGVPPAWFDWRAQVRTQDQNIRPRREAVFDADATEFTPGEMDAHNETF